MKHIRVVRATSCAHDCCVSAGEKLSREHATSQVLLKSTLRHVIINECVSNSSDEDDNGASADAVTWFLDNTCNSMAVIRQHLLPIRCVLALLEDNFSPNFSENPHSLQLASTYSLPRFSFFYLSHSPKLSHSHFTHHTFAW